MELIFATHNRHKLEEAAAIAGAGFSILGLTDIGCFEEIPETADSLLGNATQKADFVFQKYHCDCFSDDTGLEIEALQNRPGVYSARYAGEHCSFQDNIDKVMSEMREIEKGTSGFGYDPIFRPHHSPLTFAEMDEVTKNSMSHRAIAMQKMMDFLCKNQI